MRVLSVCSGIGSDAVAWHPLGWETAAFAETNQQASAVLAHHYPNIPNLEDFTNITEQDIDGSIDLLVGGTPCQSFSTAGLRGGMDDDRGNLALEFCRLAGRVRPRWIVWENVPGVFSLDGGAAFGSIVGALAELGYGVCWHVLDAQYVRVESHPRAVPQRRRRVFVVGYLGDWRPPFAVLLEPEGMRGDPPPRREAGEDVAGSLSARTSAGGGLGTALECGGGVVAYGGNNTSGPIDVFSCKDHGADAGDVSPTLRAMTHDMSHANAGGQVAVAIQERATSENAENGPDGIGVRDDGAAYTLESRATPQAIAFDARQDPCVYGDKSGPLDTGISPVSVLAIRGRDDGSQLEINDDGVANAILTPSGGRGGIGVGAFHSGTLVRRITPLEAERLMGLPDGYTLIPYRGKPMADGPRYRMLGNGIAINCLRWLGDRISMFERITK